MIDQSSSSPDRTQEILAELRSRNVFPSATLDLRRLQTSAYKLIVNDEPFFLKWIANSDRRGLNELQIYRDWLPDRNLSTPHFIREVPGRDARIAIWDWIEGSDLRHAKRNLLQQAFRTLSRFHSSHRYAGPVQSSETGESYSSIEKLLPAELELLGQGLTAIELKAGLEILMPLRAGFPTRNHGDVHPGNIIHCGDELIFVDWAHAHMGVNLFDLDYVIRPPLRLDDSSSWWTIGPEESRQVLDAYFEGSDLSTEDVRAVHRAVMLRSQLVSRRNYRLNNPSAESTECRANIRLLIEDGPQ